MAGGKIKIKIDPTAQNVDKYILIITCAYLVYAPIAMWFVPGRDLEFCKAIVSYTFVSLLIPLFIFKTIIQHKANIHTNIHSAIIILYVFSIFIFDILIRKFTLTSIDITQQLVACVLFLTFFNSISINNKQNTSTLVKISGIGVLGALIISIILILFKYAKVFSIDILPTTFAQPYQLSQVCGAILGICLQALINRYSALRKQITATDAIIIVSALATYIWLAANQEFIIMVCVSAGVLFYNVCSTLIEQSKTLDKIRRLEILCILFIFLLCPFLPYIYELIAGNVVLSLNTSIFNISFSISSIVLLIFFGTYLASITKKPTEATIPVNILILASLFYKPSIYVFMAIWIFMGIILNEKDLSIKKIPRVGLNINHYITTAAISVLIGIILLASSIRYLTGTPLV